MSVHTETLCNHCGQVDNHPKSHWNDGNSFHFDCLPYDKKAEFIVSHPLASELVEAASSGTHGDELRAFSVDLHSKLAEKS